MPDFLSEFFTIFLNYAAFRFSFLVVLGLCIGSFLNVIIFRLPRMILADYAQFNLLGPRSLCPKCGGKIHAIDNIPLLSYIMLRGRCRLCHGKISPRYFCIELFSAIILLFMWSFCADPFIALMGYIFVMTLLILTVIDFETQLLPDIITIPFLWLGLIVNLNNTFAGIESAVIGAVIGYLSLWSIYCVFTPTTKKEGMGYGDFKLLAGIGAWLGWQSMLPVILISSTVGLLFGLMSLRAHQQSIPIPFGPFLALSGLIYFFNGDLILHTLNSIYQ